MQCSPWSNLFVGLWCQGPMWTDIGKKHRQEDQTMGRADQYNAKVHSGRESFNISSGSWENVIPKVEHSEDLGLGKGKDQDAAKLSECDAWQDGAAHVDHGLPGVLHPLQVAVDGKGARDVAAELHTDPHGHHQVDQGDGVQGDVPRVHHPPKVDQDEDDAQQNYCCRPVSRILKLR